MITKQFLDGCPDGKSLKVTGTVLGSANTIHTGHATNKDEVWLYAVNNDTISRELSVFIDDQETSVVSLPVKQGLLLIIPGLPVSNSQTVKVFAAAANVVFVSGWVNRIG